MIFLHSSFRVSSTWLWTRFRRLNRVVAYYEVFNELLATITPVQMAQLAPDSWASHHPADRAYFVEFLPFMQAEGGIANYDRAMAFDRFMPAEPTGALGAEECFYLAQLIDYAQRRGKIPILSETRSLGRIGAIKAACPGTHILIYRNLFHQWCSYLDQYNNGNPYFLTTIGQILSANGHDPFIAYLTTLFPLEQFGLTSRLQLYCFVLLHLYLYARAVEVADLVIDIGRLAGDAGYREKIEGLIALASGLVVDLSDAVSTTTRPFAELEPVAALIEDLEPLVEMVLVSAPSGRGRDFAAGVFADFIAAYRRYGAAGESGEISSAAKPCDGDREDGAGGEQRKARDGGLLIPGDSRMMGRMAP